MKWEIDPDLSLQSRLSFGRWVAPVIALAIVGQIAVLLAPASREVMAKGFGLLALAALTMAGPYAAVHLLSLEGDARLDQQRLSGRSDMRLSVVLLAGSIWPLVAFALPGIIPLLNAEIGSGRVAAIVLGGVATGALMLAAPRAARMDSWLLLALGAVTGMVLVGALVYRPSGAITAAVVSLLCTTAAYPVILRRLRRAPVLVDRRRRNLFRRVVRLSSTRLPDFSRALLTAGAAGAQPLFLIAAAPIGMVFLQSTPAAVRDVFQIILVYAPLALAGFQWSASARAEATPAGFDLLRLAAGRPWVVVLQLAAGFAMPYVAISAAAALTLLVLRPGEAWSLLWAWPAAAVLFTGIGMAEGFGRRRLGVYLALVTPVLVLSARTPPKMAVLACLVLWIPVAMAAGRLKDAAAAPLRGTAAVAAAGSLGAVAVFCLHHTTMPLALVAGAVSLGAGLFVPDHRPGGGLTFAARAPSRPPWGRVCLSLS